MTSTPTVSSGRPPGRGSEVPDTRLSSPEPAGGLSTLVEERTQTSTGDGDHDRFSHYVIRDKLTEAMVEGTPLRALCGKVWVPSRDPQKYPICPECKEIYEGIPRGDDEPSGDS